MRIQPLSAEDEAALARGLAVAGRLAGAEPPLNAAQVQTLYDDFLERPAADDDIRALGVAFGALLVAGRPFEWVRVDDEWGSELALGIFGMDVSCHPVSMIEHRLEDREPVDIARLVEMTVEELDRIVAGGAALRRSDGEER